MFAFLESTVFWHAVLAGVAVAAAAGSLGVFVVWRRIAYFGDAIAHSAVLGAALGLLLQIEVTAAIFLSSLCVTALLALLQKYRGFSTDTFLGILAHGTLALGIVLLALLPGTRVDVPALLFGDILSVGTTDIWIAWSVATGVIVTLAFFWRELVLATISDELAAVEGINTHMRRMLLHGMIAATMAVSVKIVGALLVTSLLILPAAAARNVSSSPTQMAVASLIIGTFAVFAGLAFSFHYDLPAGPAIVLAAFGCFALFLIIGRNRA